MSPHDGPLTDRAVVDGVVHQMRALGDDDPFYFSHIRSRCMRSGIPTIMYTARGPITCLECLAATGRGIVDSL